MQRSTWAHLRSETEKAIEMGMVEAFTQCYKYQNIILVHDKCGPVS